MRTVTVVGARPQFIKVAPVSREMNKSAELHGVPIDDLIVHTGQHYDREMSKIFFEELRIPEPYVDLAIGSASHGVQTAKMLNAIESLLLEHKPDVVIVYGDTNSTAAAALAAAKIHIPIAHVEAGLRSFDRQMPEEVNRIVADHLSELLFAPTQTAVENLRAENLLDRTRLVGDVMYDAVLYYLELAASRPPIIDRLRLAPGGFAVATIHRASNTEEEPLGIILDALNEVAESVIPVVFPMHPRTRAQIRSCLSDWKPADQLKIIDPVGYLDMLRLLDDADIVLTDSGGLQKEAYFVRTRCVTLRESTEWIETVQAGANVLVPIERQAILGAAREAVATGRTASDEQWENGLFGDGQAAEKIVADLARIGT